MRFPRNRMQYFALLGALPWLPIVHAQSTATGETSPSQAQSLPEVATGFDGQEAASSSHWGLGIGVAMEGLPYKGFSSRVTPVPYVFYDNRWISFIGNTFDLKAWQGNGFTFSLRTKFSLFDGYTHSDASIFRGMANRNGALWYGPHVGWHYGEFSISTEYLTSTRGQQGELSLERGFDFGSWHIAPHVGFHYMNRKYVDYYYGVRANEATSTRPVYDGKSSVNVTAGVSATWHLDARQSIRGDVGVTQFGSGITDSPLVGRKTAPSILVGYIYRFK